MNPTETYVPIVIQSYLPVAQLFGHVPTTAATETQIPDAQIPMMPHPEGKDGVPATTMPRREALKLIHDIFEYDPCPDIQTLNDIAKDIGWLRHEVHDYFRKLKRLEARTCKYCQKVLSRKFNATRHMKNSCHVYIGFTPKRGCRNSI